MIIIHVTGLNGTMQRNADRIIARSALYDRDEAKTKPHQGGISSTLKPGRGI